jgi:hypothetical protein
MILRVKDVTNLNQQAAFRNDVQIDEYRSADNLELTGNFMFTSGDVPGKRSTASLLETFCKAIMDKQENRFLIRATYGQGKSHFALAIANFFGRAADSLEVKTVIEAVQGVVKEAPRVAVLRDFKKHHKPFLTLLLRGDKSESLREKVFKALELALQDHEATRGIQTPFWFATAEEFFRNLEPKQIQKANKILEKHKIELTNLLEDLEKRRADRYNLCIDVASQLLGVRPDFGGETSLAEAIDWAVTEFCGKDKPLGGVLVLFDEFSVFVQSYLANNPVGVPLSELLNGISKHNGKAICIAFSQHEPERMVGTGSDTSSEALRKELNRFPNVNRFVQHSSLEDVLSAYFRPNPEAWKSLMKSGDSADAIDEATDIAYTLFKARYKNSMNWSQEMFLERVSRDCFPLHPIITALLASLELEGAAGSTRNIIGFLRDDKQPVVQSLEQPALLENGLPNFIYPIALVDYFKEMLNSETWKQYQSVKIPDLMPNQKLVLKAMMLQISGNLESKPVGGYANLIAALSGLTLEEAKDSLEALASESHIKYDFSNKAYSFYTGGNQTAELDKRVQAKLEELKKNDRLKHFLDELDVSGNTWINERLEHESSPFYKRYDVPVNWGHQADWQAQELILTRKGFTSQNLERLLRTRIRTVLGAVHQARGVVITLIARDEDDVLYFREKTREILEASAEVKNAPILVLRPDSASPELFNRLLKYGVLVKEFSSQTKTIGLQIFDEAKDQAERQILNSLKQQREEAVLEVSAGFRKIIGVLPTRTDANTKIQEALKALYPFVYSKNLGSFYTNYELKQQNLRLAISTLIPYLLDNKLKDFQPSAGGPGKVAAEIIDKYLEPKWSVVLRKVIRVPDNDSGIFPLWDRLDKSCIADGEPIHLKDILTEFLNVPYGYDANTLTLAFCAWFGKYRTELIFAASNKQVSISEAIMTSKNDIRKPLEFLDLLESATLRRKNKSAEKRVLEGLLERIEKNESFKKQEAEEAKAILSLADHADTEKSLRFLLKPAFLKLHKDIGLFEECQNQTDEIKKVLSKSVEILELEELRKTVDKLEYPLLITNELPKPELLLEQIKSKVEEVAQSACQRYERLSSLEDYGLHLAELEKMSKQLSALGLATRRVDEALKSLETERTRLKSTGETRDLLERLAAISISESLGLAQLRLKKSEILQIPALSEVIGTKRAEKLEALDNTIIQFENWAGTLSEQLESVQTLETVKSLSREILKRQTGYANTTEAIIVSAALEKSDRLEKYFANLDVGKPNSPAHLTELVQKLEQLQIEYQSELNTTQLERVQNQTALLHDFAKQKTLEADAWLEDKIAKGSKPELLKSLQSELNSVPAFLSDVARERLEALRVEVQERLTALAQEKGVLAEIARIKETGSLEVLQSSLKQLEQFSPDSDALEKQLSTKRGSIEGSIEKLEQEAALLLTGLSPLTASKDIYRFREGVLQATVRFENTDYAGLLQNLSERAEIAAKKFTQVEQAQRPRDHEESKRLRDILHDLKDGLSEAQQTQIDKRIKEFQDLVLQQVKTAKQWLEDIAKLLDSEFILDKVRGLCSKLDAIPDFFPPSEQARLDATRAKGAKLESYLIEIQELRKSGSPKTPEDFQLRIKQVQGLLASIADLADEQKKIAATFFDELKNEHLKECEAARRWLANQKLALDSTKDFNQLDHQLSRPHEFLSASDQIELEELRQKVRVKIDEDEVSAITSRFKRITDKKKRQECVQALQALLLELEAI